MAIALACAAALISLLESYFLACDCWACDCCAGVVIKLHLTMQDIVNLEDRGVFLFPSVGNGRGLLGKNQENWQPDAAMCEMVRFCHWLINM